MSKSQLLSAYTPSNMDPRLLKRIFVQREKLLDLIVNRQTTSMTSGDKHHILLVGPRGSGKTHLVSLAIWELKQNPDLCDTMRIAWLGEDDVFSGLIHLAFAIAKALADEYPNEFPADFKSAVRGLPLDDAALAVLNSVIENLKHRHLLLVTENLDQTFASLGEMGQKKLRAFLQETRRIATLSTTQQLFAGVSSRNEAFFGFFDTHHLAPLTVDDALQLIRNIAIEQKKTDLIRLLKSGQARYRIRALHHLAGGNYRMYVLLAEFLTGETLDDLVAAFETLAEEMTPFFQERMRSLPDQQRQLVQCMCDATGAMTVKEIAEETFIAEGNCSRQLGNLKAKGYVRSEKRGKESYYDMAEPLMRLCLEVKNQRGRPLKLVARFLKAWFPEDQLQSSIKMAGIDSRSAEYCQVALQTDDSFETIINSQLQAEISEKIKVGDYQLALVLADELAVSDRRRGFQYRKLVMLHQEKANLELESELLDRFRTSFELSDWDSAIKALTNILNFTDLPVNRKATAQFFRGLTYSRLGDTQAAVADYNAVIEMTDAPGDQKAKALLFRGEIYSRLGDTQAALADFSGVIEMPDATSEQKASARFNRGATYLKLGDRQAALVDFSGVIELPDATSEHKAMALVNRSIVYGQLGDTQAELADYNALIEMPDATSEQKAKALVNRGATYGALGDTQAALADFSGVIEMPDATSEQKAKALVNRGVTYLKLGDTQAELADYTAVIELPDATVDLKAQALLNRGVTFSQLGNAQAALADYNALIDIPDAPGDQKAKALVNRGVTYLKLGDTQAALADYTAVIELPDAPGEQKAMALANRGLTYSRLGDTQAAVADYNALIEMPDATVDLKAMALVNRGVTFSQLGNAQAALADYTAVIELPDVTVDLKAMALVNRGVTFSQLGNAQAALADYTAVIELPDAPGDQKAKALVNRGATHWRNRNWQASVSDFEAALNVANASLEIRTQAMFGLPEPMIAIRPLRDVVAALERAFKDGGKQSEHYGGTPHDLLSMILERGPAEWADYISAIAPLYIKHGVADKLGQGVTRLIQILDEGGFSASQLDLWNQAWQNAGKDCEDLQIPLACLDAAVEILKSDPPTDRPLFRLPLEVRQLIRPLLRKTLSGDGSPSDG